MKKCWNKGKESRNNTTRTIRRRYHKEQERNGQPCHKNKRTESQLIGNNDTGYGIFYWMIIERGE
jgi:hypothetical protein